MRYEVTFPNAEPMVQAERDQWPIRCYGLSLMNYRTKTVAQQICSEIMRDEWLESFQPEVDRLLAVVRKMGNVERWHKSILREAIRQVDHPHRTSAPRNTYRVTIEYQKCPKHDEWLVGGESKLCPKGCGSFKDGAYPR